MNSVQQSILRKAKAAHPRPAADDPPAFPRPDVLAPAVAIGLLADLLLREMPPGLGLSAFLVLGTAISVHVATGSGLLHRRRLRLPGLLVLLAAGLVVWRDAEPFVLAAFALTLLAVSLAVLRAAQRGEAGPVLPSGLAVAGIWTLGGFLAGAMPELVRRLSPGAGSPRGASLAPALRTGLLAVPVLLVFTALFSAADPLFAGWVRSLTSRFSGELPSHLFLTGFFGWLAAGVLTLLVRPVPAPSPPRAPALPTAQEVVTALALLDLLFLAFLTSQVRWLFGGHETVLATHGLTYADYARRGFFELLWAGAFVVPILLASAWITEGAPAGAQRTFRWVSRLLLALVAAMLASAVHRLGLYVDAYGLTTARVYGVGVLASLAGVLGWIVPSVFRGRRHLFLPGALAMGTTAVIALAALDPEALVTRSNLRRAVAGAEALDVDYLLRLDGGAVPALVEGLDQLPSAASCPLAMALLERRERSGNADWRAWNRARARAREALEKGAPRLREHAAACGAAVPGAVRGMQ